MLLWLNDREVEMISDPVMTEIAGQPAVHVVHEKTFDDGDYTLRAYAAVTNNGAWFHYIEVSGYSEDSEITQSYYEDFVASFAALE